MKNSDTSSILPWTVTVIMSIVLSQYCNQLFLLQYDIQVHSSHLSKHITSYKATATNQYPLEVINGIKDDLSTKKPVIQTHNEDLPTPIQLKDFGQFAKNRRVSQLFIIHRV